jgi:hypothetical protein
MDNQLHQSWQRSRLPIHLQDQLLSHYILTSLKYIRNYPLGIWALSTVVARLLCMLSHKWLSQQVARGQGFNPLSVHFAVHFII